MAEKNLKKTLAERLRSGEIIDCDSCKKGHYVPYNASYEEAHLFKCSNCDAYVHLEPVINIE